MKVKALVPRGYCHGVVYAINRLKTIAFDKSIKRPIYVLGMIVHNEKITKDFFELGIITLNDPKKTRLELLDLIDTGTVVFTAHGVSDLVYQKAKEKGLDIIDTTCKDVHRSQNIIKDYLHEGYHVLFVGKKNHPESETVLSYSPKVHLIDSLEKAASYPLSNDVKYALTNQTTMSLFDIYAVSETLKKRIKDIILIDEICDATKTRQLALMQQDKAIQHCFVVGDHTSNNANKLVEVSTKQGINASLIHSVEDLDINLLKTLNYVSVTAAASTPSQLTKEVIDFLVAFDKHNPNTFNHQSKVLKKNLFQQ